MSLEFSEDEAEILRELVTESLKRLAVEIHRTDSLNYRAELLEREKTLKAIRARLTRTAVGAQV